MTEPSTTPPEDQPAGDAVAASDQKALREAGAVDASGAWVPPVPQSRAASSKPKRRTLQEWAAYYDYEKNPHPLIHLIKAAPMGFDPKSGARRPAMNHSQEVMNYIAIHLARQGVVVPPLNLGPWTTDGECEIKYVEPEHGPRVLFNPGTWVDIDAVVVDPAASAPVPEITLTGVPQNQLDALKAAVHKEEVRLKMAQGADPAARDAALAELAAEPTMDVAVVPASDPAAEPATESADD